MKAFWSHPAAEPVRRLAVLPAEPLVWLDPYHQPLSALEQRLTEAKVQVGDREGVEHARNRISFWHFWVR